MAIMLAMEKDGWVYVYNMNNSLMWTEGIVKERGEGLMAFTSSTVTIRKNNEIVTFDENHNRISSKLC